MFLFRRPINSDNNPIVLVPGLFGSLGNDIIPGSGRFGFGLAEDAYRPMINNLKSMGYEQGKNLFIAFYDWRKENLYSAEKYLLPVVKMAKETTGSRKVNLICHSMGGLVARSYISSEFYTYDVDKLIMIGTPNSGSMNAYYFWQGGQLPYEKVENNFFYKILKEGFIWIFKILYGAKNDIDLLHRIFPSAGELIPCNEYGDYLFYENNEGYREFIPINKMKYQNTFLNELNSNNYLLSKYGVTTFLIVGRGIETNRYLCVEKNRENSKAWVDGKPKYSIATFQGDGTVTSHSAASVGGYINYITSNHTDILYDCRFILSNILNRKIRGDFSKKQIKKYYGILTRNIESIDIRINNKIRRVQNINEIDSEDINIRRIGKNIYWIIIKLDQITDIELTFDPLSRIDNKILILDDNEKEVIKKIKEYSIREKTVIYI